MSRRCLVPLVPVLSLALSACPASKGGSDGGRHDGSTGPLCQTSADCADSATGNVCDTSSGACVQCVVTADCPNGDSCSENMCLPPSAQCSPACSGATPVCVPATHACVECAVSGDCRTSTTGHVCETSSHQCVACLADSDCSASPATPICDTSHNVCVTCIGSRGCSGSTPICHGGTCIGCVANSDCVAPTPICDTTLSQCVECTTDANCASSANGHSCTNNQCVCMARTAADGCTVEVNGQTLVECGTVANGCGGTLSCAAACASGTSCSAVQTCEVCGGAGQPACSSANGAIICPPSGNTLKDCLDPSDCATGQCQWPGRYCCADLGNPCQSDSDCQPSCGLGTAGQSGTCMTCQSGVCVGPAGSPCMSGSSWCASGTTCQNVNAAGWGTCG